MNEVFVCEMKKIYVFISTDRHSYKLFILNNKSLYCSLITHLCVFNLFATLCTFLLLNHAWDVQHEVLSVSLSLRVQVLTEGALERDLLPLAVCGSRFRLGLQQVQGLAVFL